MKLWSLGNAYMYSMATKRYRDMCLLEWEDACDTQWPEHGGFQKARTGMISVFQICIHLYVHVSGDTDSHEGMSRRIYIKCSQWLLHQMVEFYNLLFMPLITITYYIIIHACTFRFWRGRKKTNHCKWIMDGVNSDKSGVLGVLASSHVR